MELLGWIEDPFTRDLVVSFIIWTPFAIVFTVTFSLSEAVK